MKPFRYGLLTGLGLFLLAFASVRADDAVPLLLGRASDMDQRLKSIVVSVDFSNASIDEAVKALSAMSKEQDPYHKGINFVIQPEASSTGKPVTLKLDKVPLNETLRYVCELGGVRYKVQDYSVSITPTWWMGDELDKRTFHVDPSFVGLSGSASVTSTSKAP